jgi:hypothetical protein
VTQDPFYEGLPDEDAEVSEFGNLGESDTTAPARFVEAGEHVEPVDVVVTQVCSYKRKPCGTCGKPKSNPAHRTKGGTCKFKRQLGCARCGLAKSHANHFGAPESFNLVAGRDPNTYRSLIESWKKVLRPLIAEAGLPGGLARVVVEGEVSFGDERERDQGNHRVLIEKAVGDALVEGGWLAKDSWAFYEFGGLQRVEEPGVSRTRLMLFPSAPALPEEPAQGELL